MKTLSSSRVLALLLVLPLAVVGCGDGGEEEMEFEPVETAPPIEEAPAPTDAMAPMTLSLQPVNNSGVSGQVTVTHQDDQLMVAIDASNLPEGGPFQAHIHQGTCETGGGVVVPLTEVQATAGTGTSTTTVEAAQVPAEAFVQVHGADGQPIACVNIESMGMPGTMPGAPGTEPGTTPPGGTPGTPPPGGRGY